MKITSSTTYKFEFDGLNKGIPHPITQGQRGYTIQSATVTWTVYDEPQEDLDGDTVYMDYRFRGRKHKSNGQLDKRCRTEPVQFLRHVDTIKYLIELVSAIPTQGYATMALKEALKVDLERAEKREKEQLERLLK